MKKYFYYSGRKLRGLASGFRLLVTGSNRQPATGNRQRVPLTVTKYLFVLFVILVSCEKPANWDIKPVADERIVVDGIITNESASQQIILSKINNSLNDSVKPVSGAIVQVKTSDTTFIYNEIPVGSGIYLSDSTTKGIEGETYELFINWNGKTISGSDKMNTVLPMSIAAWEKNESSGLYRFTFVCPAFNTTESAMYKLELDWSMVAGYSQLPPEDCRAVIYYYSLQSVDLGELLGPVLEKVLFPADTKVIEKKYSLSPDHAGFIRTMLLETQWRGGFFDAPPSNVTSNLKGDAVGFFGASSVISRTFFIAP